QEALHAADVRRRRPRRVPAPALRVRPGRPGEPREGDADAAPLRRGSGAVPPAPARGRWRGRALLMVAPRSYDEAAAALKEAAGVGHRVRIRGSGTKLGWGALAAAPDVELSTERLD